jgi:hypothetical protein
MKILALEKEIPGIPDDAYEPHLKAEALKAWEYYQSGVIRELYFRSDWPGAVLILECRDTDEARQMLGQLPLVKNHLIAFDIIPLLPYPGFSRLFEKSSGERGI